MNKKEVDIVIKNGQVLTIDADMRVIENGGIAIEGDAIVGVGDSVFLSQFVARKEIDAKKGIVMPGMINTHNHLPMIAFRGLGEEGISDRLMGYFIPLEQQMLSRELIYQATIHGAIDMAMSGVTTYADMYYHVDEMAKATREVGLRAILGQTIVGFPVVDASKPNGGLEYAKHLITEFKGDPLISLALAPHAPYTVSKGILEEIKNVASKNDLLVHTHAAEFAEEKDQISDNTSGLSVIKYLNSFDFLDSNVLLAHCNYLDNEDLDLLKKRNVAIAHNPLANAKGATGTAPIYEAHQMDIRIGLGTDGPMGSNVVDLFKAMTYTTTIQRLRLMDRTIMTPEIVVKMATFGGARALGMEDKIGSLEVNKKADVIILETDSTNMIPNYDPYATLVFQANPHNVTTTIVAGQLIVENRKLQRALEKENNKNMKRWSEKIKDLGKKLAIEAQRKDNG